MVSDFNIALIAIFLPLLTTQTLQDNWVFFVILLTRDACSAKRGNAIVKSSVRPSVRLSVTLRYREHIGWTSSKLITPIISLGLRSSEPQHRQSSPRGPSQNSGGIGVGSLFSAENLQYI